MSRHAAPAVDDSGDILRSNAAVASLSRGLRAIAAHALMREAQLVDRMLVEEAADMLVTLLAQRDSARDLAARLEEENARLEEAGSD